MKLGRFSVVLLTVTMAASLISCKSNTSETVMEKPFEADTSEFVTIKYLALGSKPTNGQLEHALNKVNEILKKKINAELVWEWADWGELEEAYYGRLTSGEPLDLITIGTDWLATWDYAGQGAFLPLDQLLPNYAPLTYRSIPKADWLKSTYQSQIVLIPENDFTQWVNHGFFYRGDWAKEAGIMAPITDFPTLGKYFQYVKDNKPGVIPWDETSDNPIGFAGYIESATDMLSLPIHTGFLNVFWTKSYADKYTVESPIFTEAFASMAKLMKDWGDRGYWRHDVLSYKGDSSDQMVVGRSGAAQHHTNTFKSFRVEMDKAQPGSEVMMFPFSATRKNLIETSITHGGTAVGAHSLHPERALMVYDLMRNDEQMYRLINYGIEGVNYIIKDGKITPPPGYIKERDMFYSNFWGGRVDKFELPKAIYWDRISEMYAQYDTYKKPYPYGQFVLDRTGITAELAAIEQITNELGPAIVFGKAGDPVKAVEQLRAKLKAAGYDKVLEEIQKQMDQYKKLVEGLVESQK